MCDDGGHAHEEKEKKIQRARIYLIKSLYLESIGFDGSCIYLLL